MGKRSPALRILSMYVHSPVRPICILCQPIAARARARARHAALSVTAGTPMRTGGLADWRLLF